MSTDFNWLKYSWKDDSDNVLEYFKKADTNKLPFNNIFFKARSGKMANAKADYVKTIEGLQSSYVSIINNVYPTKGT